MDAFEQLTTQVIPALIAKIKEQKESIVALNARVAFVEGQMQQVGDLLQKANLSAEYDIDRSLRDILAYVRGLETRITTLEVTPAPAPKKRAPRKKKEESAPATKGERFGGTVVANITGDDILSANYALSATKGDVDEACMLMPDIDKTRMETIARMCSEQVREIVAASPTTVTNIDSKYASARWDEIA